MPGTHAVDITATFTSMMLVNSMPKLKFGSESVQETNAAGVPKWSVDLAVTYTPTVAGMRAESELITVTIADHANPAQGMNPGSPVALEGMRVGLNPAEVKNERLRGGKLWFTATALRNLAPPASRRENAA